MPATLSSNEANFSLEVLGYQFPHLDDDGLDSDWLEIRLVARTREHKWTSTDPAFTTSEARRMRS
jgi:hypothetical protein